MIDVLVALFDGHGVRIMANDPKGVVSLFDVGEVRVVMSKSDLDRFAPITSSIGFIQVSLEKLADAFFEWNKSLYETVSRVDLLGSLPALLPRLEPLTGGSVPRVLLVECSGGWTAYFDCSLRGTDAVGPVGYMSEKLLCQGVAIRCTPTRRATRDRPGQWGSTQFELFGPLPTEFLNAVRAVSVAYTGSRWRFDEAGTVQTFEDTDAYRARKIQDRFTPQMLEQYCRALDIDPFNIQAYGPRAVLFESSVIPAPDGYVMSLAEVQMWLGIAPF